MDREAQATGVVDLLNLRHAGDVPKVAFDAPNCQVGADRCIVLTQGAFVTELRLPDGASQKQALALFTLEDLQQEGSLAKIEIRVEPDGAVGVLHCQGGSKAVLCTPTCFATSGDALRVSYGWNSAEGAQLTVHNLTTDQTDITTSSKHGLMLDFDMASLDLSHEFGVEIASCVLLDSFVPVAAERNNAAKMLGKPLSKEILDRGIQAGEGDETVFSGSGSDTTLGRTGDDAFIGDGTVPGGVAASIPDDSVQANRSSVAVAAVPSGDILALTEETRASVTDGRFEVKYDEDDPNRGTVTFFDADGRATGTTEFSNIERVVPCFTPGTLIATPKGERKVEDLQTGDRVITRDNGIQEIRWVGHRTLRLPELARAAHLQPVLIREGSLSAGLPERDMLVSPNHRMLVANDKTALYFEEREVLVAAKHLTGLKGVDQVEIGTVTYIHFMFDQHEVVLSDGAWSESFQPGDQSLAGMGNAQRNEIYEIFPDLKTEVGRGDYSSARRSLKRHEARLLM